MIKTFKIFELTMQQFSRQFRKERDDGVDKNIPEIPGRYYWKVKSDDFVVIGVSLDKIGAPKEMFNDIKLCQRRGFLGKNHFIEVWHNENYKNEDVNNFTSDEWDWNVWEHDKRLKGFNDRRYKAGYKYMGVVKLTKEEIELYRAIDKYNL
jgi:hypothetical protein